MVLVGSQIGLISGMGKTLKTWRYSCDAEGKEKPCDGFFGSDICFSIKAVTM